MIDHQKVRYGPPASVSAAAAKSKNDSFKEKEFTFSRVFQEDATQEDLYFVAAQPLVDALLVGKNGLLFTYGVSSAGKSYTMMGAGDGEAQGIVPRVLSVLLERAAAGATLALTCIEVHLENVYDLLAAEPKRGARRAQMRLKDNGTHIELPSLTSKPIGSVEEGIEQIERAARQRTTTETALNKTSSRSHMVLTIEMKMPDGRPSATLSLVDLAGSERSKRAHGGAGGGLMSGMAAAMLGAARDGGQAETNFINKSISNLMLCLRTVVYNQTGEAGGAERQAVVPWRNSKLTQLFQYHLHGKRPARTVMIVNAAPAADCWQETSHVIANAAFSQEVKASSLAQEAKETKLRTLAPPEYGADGRRIVSRASSGADEASATGGAAAGKRAAGVKRAAERAPELDGGVAAAAAVAAGPAIELDGADAPAELARLVHENNTLREGLHAAHARLGSLEAEIRMECASEMQQSLREVHSEYRKRLRRAESEAASSAGSGRAGSAEMALGAAPAPAKLDVMQSARKLQREGELQKYVEQLEEQLDEAEAELERVREQHAGELARAGDVHAAALRASDARAADAERRVAALERELVAARAARGESGAPAAAPMAVDHAPAAFSAPASRGGRSPLSPRNNGAVRKKVIHDRAMGIKSRAAKAGAPALGGDADAAMAEENLVPPRAGGQSPVARRTRAGHKPVTSAIRV